MAFQRLERPPFLKICPLQVGSSCKNGRVLRVTQVVPTRLVNRIKKGSRNMTFKVAVVGVKRRQELFDIAHCLLERVTKVSVLTFILNEHNCVHLK